jgi:hypothetical protein
MMQARKTLRCLKGKVRLQIITHNNSFKKQAATTLNYLHSWSQIQAQIRARRLFMVSEGRLRQKKLENQLKLEAKLHDLEVRKKKINAYVVNQTKTDFLSHRCRVDGCCSYVGPFVFHKGRLM